MVQAYCAAGKKGIPRFRGKRRHRSPALRLPQQPASDEIQVYTEEMDESGEFGLELRVN